MKKNFFIIGGGFLVLKGASRCIGTFLAVFGLFSINKLVNISI